MNLTASQLTSSTKPLRAPGPILVSAVGEAYGARAAAAALACELAGKGGGALFIDLGGPQPRPTLLASRPACELEEKISARLRDVRVAARGSFCQLVLDAGPEGLATATEAITLAAERPSVVHLPLRLLLSALAGPRPLKARGILLRADLSESRRELVDIARQPSARNIPLAVLKDRLDWVTERRALFGALPPDPSAGLPRELAARLM